MEYNIQVTGRELMMISAALLKSYPSDPEVLTFIEKLTKLVKETLKENK